MENNFDKLKKDNNKMHTYFCAIVLSAAALAYTFGMGYEVGQIDAMSHSLQQQTAWKKTEKAIAKKTEENTRVLKGELQDHLIAILDTKIALQKERNNQIRIAAQKALKNNKGENTTHEK